MKKYLALLLVLMLLLSACGAKSEDAASMETAAAPMAPAKAEEAGEALYDLELAPEEPMDAPEEVEVEEDLAPSGETGTEQNAIDPTQKLIYRADLSVETLYFDAAVASLERLAGSLGGFVETSNISGNTRYQPDGTTCVVDRWANYVLRVPSDRFQEAVRHAGDLGSVVSSGTSVENITSQFTDQEARRHSLEVQEERLLSMLEKAEDVDTLVILESRLSEVRYEIESIERQLRNWQQEVDYSTVAVELQEVEAYTPSVSVQRSFSERVGDALSGGWQGFVRFLQDAVLVLAASLPALVLLLVLAAAALLIVLRLRKRRKQRALPKHPADDPEKKSE